MAAPTKQQLAAAGKPDWRTRPRRPRTPQEGTKVSDEEAIARLHDVALKAQALGKGKSVDRSEETAWVHTYVSVPLWKIPPRTVPSVGAVGLLLFAKPSEKDFRAM